MTVQELCEKLAARRLQEVEEATASGNVIPDDVFADALTPQWLADNIDTVFGIVNSEDSKSDDLIGNLEINAFLAAFQKAFESARRGRVTRWAAVYSEMNRSAAADGPLNKQLKNLGVKVDDEFTVAITQA